VADVQIDSAVALQERLVYRSGTFWTSTTTGYLIFLDGSLHLHYRKTADGGATWAETVIQDSNYIYGVDCWADWQTDGDAGTKIHISYTNTATNVVAYQYLDTNGDSLSGEVTVEAAQGAGAVLASVFNRTSITKSVGGNLCIACSYFDTTPTLYGIFYTSPDGTTWTSKTSPFEAAEYDHLKLYPANLADTNDIWGLYGDNDVNELSLKTWDNSGNSWAETAIVTYDTQSYDVQYDGVVRLSDGHLLVAVWNDYDNAAADIVTFDITDAGTITARTDAITDTNESFATSCFHDHNAGRWYVAYCVGGTAHSLVTVYYKYSDDSGVNWSAQQSMQANAADDERWITSGAVKAAWGGFYQPVWYNDDLADLFCNVDNDVAIAAAAGGGWATIAKVNGVGEAVLGKVGGVAKADIAMIMGTAV